jgi:predicted O-methyltransferase YrrM
MTFDTNVPGWMTSSDLAVLHKLAGLVPKSGSIIEVGCFLGRSTDAFFNGKDSSVKMTVVDSFQVHGGYETHRNIFAKKVNEKGQEYIDAFGSQELYDAAKELANSTGDWLAGFKYCVGQDLLDDINLHKSYFKDFNLDPKGYDLAFIDASHKFEDVLFDISKFITNQKTLIVGDDFTWAQPGVARALTEVRRGDINGRSTKRLLIVPECSKIWMLVPVEGYWKEQFRKKDSFFFE